MRGLICCKLLAVLSLLYLPSIQATTDLLTGLKRHDEVKGRSPLPEKTAPGTCTQYNFKHPHCCTPPHCSFMVSWVDTGEGYVDFALVANVTGNASVWAALGFSDNDKMGDTDVVACWVPESTDSQIHHGWIKPGERDFTMDHTNKLLFKPINASLVDGKLYCRFSRQKNLSPDLNETLTQEKAIDRPVHILAASGVLQSTVTSDGQHYSMMVHTTKVASECKCNVTNCEKTCVCMSGVKYLLLKLHGVLMTIAFVFFLPSGALISRYYKIVFSPSWFRGHVAIMIFGLLSALVGLGLILGHTDGQFTPGFHQIVGVVCLSLSLVQPLVGCIRPEVGPTVRRRLFNIFHRTLAVFILSLGIAALFLGIYLFSSTKMIWMMATLGLSVITNLGFMLLLEFLTRTQKFSSSVTHLPPVGYHKVTKHDELSESEEEVFVRDLPSKLAAKKQGSNRKSEPYRFEQGLLMLFVIQSFCFAGLISGIIYFYDSTHM